MLSNSFCGVVICICVWLALLRLGLSEPYPKEGKVIYWTQPDGVVLALRVFGDEFYARTATESGYTVVFDPERKGYFYAKPSADGESLTPGGVPADQPPPPALQKHLEESSRVIAEIRAKNEEKYAPDRTEDWNARKRAVQARRAQGGASPSATPTPSASPTSPSGPKK